MPLVLPPFVFLAPIFVSLGLLAIYTDEFQIKNSTFYRSKNPILFGGCVTMMLFLGIGMFLYGIGVIGQRWGGSLDPEIQRRDQFALKNDGSVQSPIALSLWWVRL